MMKPQRPDRARRIVSPTQPVPSKIYLPMYVVIASLLYSRRMYSRGCTYSGTWRIDFWLTIPRYGISRRPPYPLVIQQGSSGQHHAVCHRIGSRLSHAAAAKDGERDQCVTEAGTANCPTPSNGLGATRKVRSMTYDAQHKVGDEPSETWKREQDSDQIANFLQFDPVLQPQRSKRKMHRLFVNNLLKDKGSLSYDWRIALSDLLNYYSPKPSNTSEDTDIFDLTPRSIQAAGSPTRDICGSDGEVIPARDVAPLLREPRSIVLARDIPLPTVWSQASLAAYVEALSKSQRYQNRVAFADKPQLSGWTNIGDVVAAFDTIFYNSHSQKLLSVEACNNALGFFINYGKFRRARALYVRMEDLRMRISTHTFNLMLRGSAWHRDLHNFTYLLNNMIRRGFKPDEVTWTLFLQVNDSSKLREIIARKMMEMNMLDRVSIRRNVASHMVYYEIANHLGNGHDHKSFIDHMTNKYGNGWLSNFSGNKLLDEVAKRKTVEDSMDLLYQMKAAGFSANDISINTLLQRCSRTLHDLAFHILDIFQHIYATSPGPQAYLTLFLMAWRNRMPILCSVIWRSACIYGATSHRMRILVFRYLLSPSPRSRKFPHTSTYPYAVPHIFEEGGWNPDIDRIELNPEEKTVKWARSVMERSLCLTRTSALKSNLSALLHEALEIDNDWKAKRRYVGADWREVFRVTISVAVRPDPSEEACLSNTAPDALSIDHCINAHLNPDYVKKNSSCVSTPTPE